MATRTLPYNAFNFIITFDGDEVFGGFSDVSGIGTEFAVAEYRTGNAPENHVHKVPGLHKCADVTLKRGVVNSKSLWDWILAVKSTGPEGRKQLVRITLRDEVGKPIQSWMLKDVIPLKYTGPTLNAKGGGDVAMEELVLSGECLAIHIE